MTILSLFLIFLQKNLQCIKSLKTQTNDFYILEVCARKPPSSLLFFACLFLLLLADLRFSAFTNFRKKKIDRLEIVLIASVNYTTGVYPYQPTYRAPIYMPILLFVAVCEDLFCMRTFFICENFFFFTRTLLNLFNP